MIELTLEKAQEIEQDEKRLLEEIRFLNRNLASQKKVLWIRKNCKFYMVNNKVLGLAQVNWFNFGR